MHRSSRIAQRVRTAFQLQSTYMIDPEHLAFVLGMTASDYQRRLDRLGCYGSTDAEFAPRERGESAKIIGDHPSDVKNDRVNYLPELIAKLQRELLRFADDEGLPDKGQADSITALARTVKAVSELVSSTMLGDGDACEAAGEQVDLEDVAKALALIDRRMDELADIRAHERLRGRAEPATDNKAGG